MDTHFETLREILAWRRDVRRFREDPVPEDLLTEALSLVQLAPSVGNSQPWRWVRVDDPKTRSRIQEHFHSTNQRARLEVPDEKRAEYDALKLAGLKEAPIQLAVFCDEETTQGGGLGRQTMAETLEYSVVCAVMTFWLAARAKGLGVGWVSILEPEKIADLLDVPASWSLVAYLCVGFPVEAHLDPELERSGWQTRVWSPAGVIER